MSLRKPTPDELAGMAWWNNLTERQRSAALQLAKANSVAEAWDWQKQVKEADGFDVRTAYPEAGCVALDEQSAIAGYLAGRAGKPPDVPRGSDRPSFISGIIEGKADRDAGRDHPLSRKPHAR